jgi:membrane-bound lytic murein transglycosylase B
MPLTRRTVLLCGSGERAERLYTGGCHARRRLRTSARSSVRNPMPITTHGSRRSGPGAGRGDHRGYARPRFRGARLPARRGGAGPQPDRVPPHDGGLPRPRRVGGGRGARPVPGGPGAVDADDIERSTGVDANVLAAIWGVETRFGTRLGEIPVISATSTLAWEGRRGRFFEAQLLAALRIIQSGDTTTDRMTGSWAGAMGHTQLMPTVYQEYAVDFRGDGRREIWSDDPTDALASTANYLVRYNWRRGSPGATRCTCPRGSTPPARGGTTRAPSRSGGMRACGWPRAGRSPTTGRPRSTRRGARTGRPGCSIGTSTRSCATTRRRITGSASATWRRGCGRRAAVAQLRAGRDRADAGAAAELQERLNAAGFDAGTPDGVFGRRTEAAIRAFQQARGLPVTGVASPELLAMLR